jgi:hypothetical protein
MQSFDGDKFTSLAEENPMLHEAYNKVFCCILMEDVECVVSLTRKNKQFHRPATTQQSSTKNRTNQQHSKG